MYISYPEPVSPNWFYYWIIIELEILKFEPFGILNKVIKHFICTIFINIYYSILYDVNEILKKLTFFLYIGWRRS